MQMEYTKNAISRQLKPMMVMIWLLLIALSFWIDAQEETFSIEDNSHADG